jgi:uncharacterized protein
MTSASPSPIRVCLLVSAFAAATFCPLRAADADAASAAKPELRGVLATASDQRFNLAIPGAGHSEWVSVGDTFATWKVAEYRAADSVLVLRQDGGAELDLSLAASHIAPDETKATLADAEAVLQKMNFAKMFAKTMNQQMKAMTGMIKQMGMGAGTGADPKIMEEYQKKAFALVQSAMNPQQMETDMAQAYSEVFTKDQLTGLGDFFDSPTGQAYVDQMPAVNQKIQAQMMPRMMALMPQLQALAKEQAAAFSAAQPKN